MNAGGFIIFEGMVNPSVMQPIRHRLFLLASAALSLTGCVSAGAYKSLQQQAQKSDSLYTWSQQSLKTCQDANDALARKTASLQNETNDMKLQLTAAQENNGQLRKQVQDMAAISSAQAESIKRSIDNIGAKDQYIRDLRSAIGHRDSVNFAVLMDMKSMMGGFGDQDVNIRLEKGILYVDLSEKLLFGGDSSSYMVNDKAKGLLARLAKVMTAEPDVEFTVEAHTESVVHPQDILVDDWDLSAKRATSVVRILQNEYNISPTRMTACGRSEYTGMAPSDTPEGRAANRRTRITILPQLDRLLRLLERGQGSTDM